MTKKIKNNNFNKWYISLPCLMIPLLLLITIKNPNSIIMNIMFDYIILITIFVCSIIDNRKISENKTNVLNYIMIGFLSFLFTFIFDIMSYLKFSVAGKNLYLIIFDATMLMIFGSLILTILIKLKKLNIKIPFGIYFNIKKMYLRIFLILITFLLMLIISFIPSNEYLFYTTSRLNLIIQIVIFYALFSNKNIKS